MEQAKGTREEAEVASKEAIIEVKSAEFQLGAVGTKFPQFIDQGLDGKGEKKRPKGIPLLNTYFGGELVLSKEEARRLSVAPLRPTGKLGELSSDLSKSSRAVDAIECIFKVKFEEAFGGAPSVGFGPAPGRMDGPICPELRGDPNLARLEKLLRVLLDSGTQALASKPAHDIANGNRSEATVGFAQSHEVGTRKVFSKLQGGDPAHKELNDFSELF